MCLKCLQKPGPLLMARAARALPPRCRAHAAAAARCGVGGTWPAMLQRCAAVRHTPVLHSLPQHGQPCCGAACSAVRHTPVPHSLPQRARREQLRDEVHGEVLLVQPRVIEALCTWGRRGGKGARVWPWRTHTAGMARPHAGCGWPGPPRRCCTVHACARTCPLPAHHDVLVLQLLEHPDLRKQALALSRRGHQVVDLDLVPRNLDAL